jgi:hypothetical protein
VHWLKRTIKRVVRAAFLRGIFPSRSFDWGVHGGELPVLMCLWNRPSRMTDILEQLDAQDHADGVRLYLWNNNRKDHQHYLSALRAFTPTGALKGAAIVRSPFNLGSIARFYWARKLAPQLHGGPVIVYDDDQDITPTFVSTAVAAYRPDGVEAFWAFYVDGPDYSDRQFAGVGDRVDHAGPGGMICPSRLFLDDRFFTRLPDEYWLIDDLWFSHFARKSGLTIRKLPVDIEFVLPETNQHWHQGASKLPFWRLLQENSPLDRAPAVTPWADA